MRAFLSSAGGHPGGFKYLLIETCMLVCGGWAGEASVGSGGVAIAFLCHYAIVCCVARG